MKISVFCLLILFGSSSAFASYSQANSEAAAGNVADNSTIKTNIGFITDFETGRLYCKFNRRQSPGSFSSMTSPFVSDQKNLLEMDDDSYAHIPNCTPGQLEVSESIAQQSAMPELKLAALPAVLAVGICAVAFVDGASLAVTFGTPDPSTMHIGESIGYQGVAYGLYQSLSKTGVSDALLLAGLRTIVKVNFACTGLGIVAGGGVRGILYLGNR